ncbi:esterase/lipase family protein [Massilia sp. DWR3-1-1]|uniref:esterase/lipase family protein n=1 Tax=Massilia sp. DWR3-1-1 TaxID=2804559 RepID=UPI003CEA0613
MSDANDLNKRGNHDAEFSQGVGGWAEYTVYMTETSDTVRHDVKVPPGKVIPVIFLPGVMGSNLRMSKKRQNELKNADNRAWRPDDLLSSQTAAAANQGFGGWYRNASPAQRQLIFDPSETEVEYYHYTEDKGRFDPDGKETITADARHKNVPDDLSEIAPLMKQPPLPPMGLRGVAPKVYSIAQIARWRGWSEVLFGGAYGDMLKIAERHLNNISRNGVIDPYGLWTVEYNNKLFGGNSGITNKKEDLEKISKCWYPVHAMGYNYLKSNSESAKNLAERIRMLVNGYQKRGFKCKEVIIVTHSMGGLVGRAILHPDYGNLLSDKDVKVLGMYHSAMPTLGAAATYRRMRFGFQEKVGTVAKIQAEIIAINGEHATAILANTQAPLEMLPALGYGSDWLKVVDGLGTTIRSWPQSNENALKSIYLQPESNWWRLITPSWVNPAKNKEDNGGGIINVYKRLASANKFLNSIEKTFHPTQCYASFCASDEHKSYGTVTFKIVNPHAFDIKKNSLPPADTWTLLSDDKKGTLTVQAGAMVLTLTLQAVDAAGDETVPAERSASKINGHLFWHGKTKGSGYEHQNSYAHPYVVASMLNSIINIALTADWKAQ